MILIQNCLHLSFRSAIRDKIIPHAVSWFTGEAVQDDFQDLVGDDDGEDDDEYEDDEEDEDEDDEEEEEEEEDSKPKKKVDV